MATQGAALAGPTVPRRGAQTRPSADSFHPAETLQPSSRYRPRQFLRPSLRAFASTVILRPTSVSNAKQQGRARQAVQCALPGRESERRPLRLKAGKEKRSWLLSLEGLGKQRSRPLQRSRAFKPRRQR